MFNLLVKSDCNAWDSWVNEFPKSRVAVEYTQDEISERFKELDEKAISELKTFPTLFVVENEKVESRIGYITEIQKRQEIVRFKFEFDNRFLPLPIGTIEELRLELDLGRYELSRTHWAIKNEPLGDILLQKGVITQKQLNDTSKQKNIFFQTSPPYNQSKEANILPKVFIVHGHNDIPRLDIESFLKELNVDPIVLHRQASAGRTIIEKIEHYSDVDFAIVLYTQCDEGRKWGTLNSRFRARQNVVFEHGYLIGKLGKERVVAILKGDIEKPGDIDGIVYIEMDENQNWKNELKREMIEADCISAVSIINGGHI